MWTSQNSLGKSGKPMLENGVDVVMVGDTLHHIEDPVAFLKGIATVMKPGGSCYILVPNRSDILRKTLGEKFDYFFLFFRPRSFVRYFYIDFFWVIFVWRHDRAPHSWVGSHGWALYELHGGLLWWLVWLCLWCQYLFFSVLFLIFSLSPSSHVFVWISNCSLELKLVPELALIWFLIWFCFGPNLVTESCFSMSSPSPQISKFSNWVTGTSFVQWKRFWTCSTRLRPIQKIKKNRFTRFFFLCDDFARENSWKCFLIWISYEKKSKNGIF